MGVTPTKKKRALTACATSCISSRQGTALWALICLHPASRSAPSHPQFPNHTAVRTTAESPKEGMSRTRTCSAVPIGLGRLVCVRITTSLEMPQHRSPFGAQAVYSRRGELPGGLSSCLSIECVDSPQHALWNSTSFFPGPIQSCHRDKAISVPYPSVRASWGSLSQQIFANLLISSLDSSRKYRVQFAPHSPAYTCAVYDHHVEFAQSTRLSPRAP